MKAACAPFTRYQDGSYLASNPTWHEEDSSWKAQKIEQILRRNNIKPSTICEVGCGAGEILKCLADHYGPAMFLTGYEMSPQAFSLCKQKERNNLRFVHGEIPHHEGVSDLLMAIDVVEHVEDYVGFMRQLGLQGRYKLLHIPLDLSVLSVLRCSPILDKRTQVGHLHYFTKETALATLRDTGYEIIDCMYTNITLDVSTYGWKNRLMRGPRKLMLLLDADLAVRMLGGFSLLVLAK